MPIPAAVIAIAAIAGLAKGASTWNANKKAKDAAADAKSAMQDEIRERNEAARKAAEYLDDLKSGKVPIPIQKADVEQGKIGAGILDALDTAKSDEAINQQVKQSEKALSAQLNISDPRVKAAIAAKAVDAFNDKQREIQAQGKEDITEAQMALGEAQTQSEQDFARRKSQAEADYANQVNSFVQNEYNRLQDVIQGHEDAGFGLRYGARTVEGQQAATSAATTDAAIGDFIGTAAQVGAAAAGNMAKGGRISDQDEKMDAARKYRLGGRFSLEEGGAAAMTKGEFNHGDPNKPETGNDQILLDQEDLKNVMDNGGVNSFDELMGVVPPQAVTTGGELIFNDKDSGEIEKRTMDTDPDQEISYAKRGTKNKRKKSKKEIRRAEAALAAYMRNLLSQEQFKK
jgi:hypothetical protein